jgi:hypothetical protein
MRKITFAFLILLLPLHLHLATAQSAPKPALEGPVQSAPEPAQEGPVPLAPKPALEGPVSQVEGSWRLTPLVAKGAAVPETNGQFQEFGETYVMENMLVFWARFGPRNNDWGLFSLKDGKLSKVLLEDVEFVAPDSRKVMVGGPYWSETRFHAGKRMLYISPNVPRHVYGWDGDRLVRVLCAGDELEVSGVHYTVKGATVRDVGPDGRALIDYDANKPQHVNGWVLHDGTSFTPLWKEGDALPGMPGVQIKYLFAARLLEDGSILATLEVTGAPYKKALFHIARDKTEKIIDQKWTRRGSMHLETPEPGNPSIVRLGGLLVARSDSFVMNLREPGMTGFLAGRVLPKRGGVTFCPDVFLPLLFYNQGEFRVESCAGVREYLWVEPHGSKAWLPYESSAVDHGMFLAPDSPRLVFTVTWTRSTLLGALQNKRRDISFPGLYFWDGKQLSAVPWETALGTTALETLVTTGKVYSGPARPKVIGLRRITRPVSGVGILLPASGPNGSSWFIPSDSTEGKLERPPQFRVPSRTVTVADVLTWRTPEEALVDLEDGFFLLTKTADAK